MNKKSDLKLLAKVYALTGKWKIPYGISIIITGIANPCIKILFVSAFKQAIDAIQYQQMELFGRACGLIVLSIIIQCIVEPLANCYNGCLINTIIYDIKKRVFNHVEKLPLSYFDKNHSGDIVSRLTSDIEKFEPIYRGNTRNIMQAVVYGISAIVYMMILSYKLAIICIIFAVIMGICNSLFNRKFRDVGIKNQNQVSNLLQSFMNIYEGISITKIFGKRDLFLAYFDTENTKMRDILIENTRYNAEKNTLTYALGMLIKMSIFIFGLYFVSRGELDIGSVVGIVALETGVSAMFITLGGFLANTQGLLAGTRRIFELLEIDEEVEKYCVEVAETVSENEYIVYDNVSFGYEDTLDVLKQINLNLKKDNVYAVVGTNGSGKSTLMKIIVGLYPARGKISIFGKGLGEYTLTEIREKVAYVDQNTTLFNTSIFDNIKYGNLNATKEEVYKAAQKANIHDFIIGLSGGYRTEVGDKGTFLSGGQRQRITLARAILKKAPIIVLDEATASLDIENEIQIFDTIKTLSKDCVIVIIAHRLSSIANVDMIYVMKNGEIAECGNHAQLMN